MPFSLKQLKYIIYLLAIIIFASVIFNNSKSNMFLWITAGANLGQMAWYLLVFTIYISLLSKLFPAIFLFKQLYPLRKYTGLLAFLFAILHVLFNVIQFKGLKSLALIYHIVFSSGIHTLGAVALIIMIPLAITSLNYFLRALGGMAWRRLHKLTHAAFILIAAHAGFINYAFDKKIKYDYLIILGIYLLAYVYLFIKKRMAKTLIS